jgi:hypothetical protein
MKIPPAVGTQFTVTRGRYIGGTFEVISEPAEDVFGRWFVWAKTINRHNRFTPRRDSVWHFGTLRDCTEVVPAKEKEKKV